MKYKAQLFYTPKYKRIMSMAILFFMIIAFLFSYIPKSYAASASASSYVESALKIHKTPAWTQSQYNAEIDKIANLTGFDPQISGGKWINPHVFEHYGQIVVYGLPHGAFYKTSKGQMFDSSGAQGEYQYLGYDKDGKYVTNNYYFGGTSTGIFTTYREVNWQPINRAESTWIDLKGEQKNYLLTTRFYDGDFKPSGSITQPPLLKDWLPDYTSKAYIQSPPGLWRGASVRLEYGPGNIHWNTIDWNPMGCEFTGELNPTATSFTLKSTENEIDISAKLSATFSDTSKLKHIERVEYAFYGKTDYKTNATIGGTYISNNLEKIFSRGQLKTGTNQVELVGSVKVHSKYNEFKEITVKKTISIIVEESKGPYAAAAMSANPDKIKFNNQDMPITLIVGYNATGITANQINKIVLTVPGVGSYEVSPTLSGSHQIKTTILANFMAGVDKKAKAYEVLVNYYLKDGTNLLASATAIVDIYTSDPAPPDPPQPDNNPPTLNINAPTSVKAGEQFYVYANAFDPDGDSLSYFWNKGIADGAVDGTGGELWYDQSYIGTVQPIWAGVTDGRAGVEDLIYVHITEPSPTAKISVGGTLKANRKVVVTDESHTVDKYPIIDRVWTITPVSTSGTLLTDIKHTGDWISVSEDILFKKAGQYTVTLEVTNSAGYTDTTSRVIDISPDLEPFVDFSIPSSAYRKQEGNAVFQLINKSYSDDNDFLSDMKVYYRQDSNNDGSYADHGWILAYDGNNRDGIELSLREIGRYQIRLDITETFGQPTIETFISYSDYLHSSIIHEVVVDNLAPMFKFIQLPERTIDIVMYVDTSDTQYSIELIKNNVNSFLKPLLSSNGVTANIQVKELQHNWSKFNAISYYDKELIESKTTYDTNPVTYLYFSQYEGRPEYRIENGKFVVSGYNQQGGKDRDGNLLGTKTLYKVAGYPSGSQLKEYKYGGSGGFLPPDSVRIENLYGIKEVKAKTDYIGLVSGPPNTFPLDGIHSDGYWYTKVQSTYNTLYSNLKIDGLKDSKNKKAYVLIKDGDDFDNDDVAEKSMYLTELLNTDTAFYGLGTYSNLNSMNIIINSNEHRGGFIDNSNLTACLNTLANNIVNSFQSVEEMDYKYFLLGEEIKIETYYSDIENDSINAEKYIYKHYPVFDNNQGVDSNSEVLLSSLPNVFSKVGKYDITAQVQDKPSLDTRFSDYYKWSEPVTKTIYVHRKPVAEPKLSYTTSGYYYNLSLSDTSYDLDHSTRTDKGIVERIWSYKDAADPDASWIEEKLEKVPVNRPVLIKLEVMDMEYEWGEKVIFFNPGNVEVPDATLTISPGARNTWAKTNISAVISYSNPAILSKIRYQVTTSANPPTSGTWIESTNATVPVSISQEGTRYIHAQGVDILGGTIVVIGGPYRIDKTAPAITVDKNGGTYESEVSVEMSADDLLSGLKNVKYAWSTSTTAPSSGSSEWTESNSTQNTTTLTIEGMYYLHIQATDNADNTRTVRYGPYTLTTNRPPIVQIIGTYPIYIYEGDDVAINFNASDPDMDNLICSIEIKKGSTTVWTGSRTVTPSGGTYQIVNLPAIQNISPGSYTASVTVNDPQGASATNTYIFTVYSLGINGFVNHTELWEQHRQKYNAIAGAAGKEEHTPEVFFDGEMFVVSADTTVINPGSSVTAENVQVSIVGTSFSTYLNKTSSYRFDKGWWEESMTRWGERSLDFLFRVAYSNGTVKVHTVRVYISKDDYWRLRLAF